MKELKTKLKSTVAIVVEGKGGVGKSLCAATYTAMLRHLMGLKPLVIDTDTTNSTSYAVEDNAVFADLEHINFRGAIQNALIGMKKGEQDALVIDTGARAEKNLLPVLPWMADKVADSDGHLIAIRPLTISSQVLANAASFAKRAKGMGVSTIFVVNTGMGRTIEHWHHWMSTSLRQEALDNGVVEIVLTDAGIRYADEAAGFGLSLADVALGNFQRAGEDAAEAESIFSPDDRAWLSIWLHEMGILFRDATLELLAKTQK